MAIPKNLIDDFELLVNAARGGRIGLLETTDKTTGATVYAIIIGTVTPDGDELVTPLAKMFTGDPFEELVPPEGAVELSAAQTEKLLGKDDGTFRVATPAMAQ